MFTLLLRLLLAAHVAGEWVEISQNHYRKEPPRRVTLNHEAAANRVYTNYSITERPWNRGVVTRPPNMGNIRRVQLPAKTINTLAIGSERINSTENTKSFMELNAFGVRAPHINNRETNVDTRAVKRKFSETFKITDENATLQEKSKIRLQIPTKPFKPPEKNTNGVTPATFQEHRKQKIEEEAFKDGVINGKPEKVESNRKIVLKASQPKSPTTSINDKSKPTEVTKYLLSLNNKKNKTEAKLNNNALSNVRSVAKNSNEINESYTKEDTEFIHSSKDETYQTLQKNEEVNRRSEQNSNGDAFQREEGNLGSKKNSVDVIMKFMKVVTDNISRNTRRSFRGKMRYLEDLRNNILANIEERIEQAWPDDTRQSTRRRREARGHVEFPSSESALMTISFLTFAVFLIKLVLQVIHTYKNKTMMVTPAVVAAVGRAAETFTRRN